MPQGHVRRARHGMTLVELMMAITVMGVLTVLMLGSMSAAHSHVASASNQANLMQLGMAMSMYTDNAGAYPPFAFEIDGTQISVIARSEDESGFDAIDTSLFLSPHHRRAVGSNGTTPAHTVPVVHPDGQTINLPVSYGYNIELLRAGLRVRRMVVPADRIVMFDGTMSGPSGGGIIGGDYQLAGADAGVLDRDKWLIDSAHDRQLKWIDVLYADGHAQRQPEITPESLSITAVH